MFSIDKQITKKILLADRHKVYYNTIKYRFDYFFESVGYSKESIDELNEVWTIDFSEPKYHKVIGYDRSEIHFPSMAEPLFTTEQYLDFAELQEGDVVLDLGCYSGLTSILFKDVVGEQGRVIGIDADVNNIHSITTNFKNYENQTGRKIEFLHSAIWKDNDGVEFSCEGSMGASAQELISHLNQDRKADLIHIPSITLDTVLEKFNLQKIDFIKCDVEGAEWVIFNETKIFEKMKPKMFIELHPHRKNLDKLTNNLIAIFQKYGYECKTYQTDELDYVMTCEAA